MKTREGYWPVHRSTVGLHFYVSGYNEDSPDVILCS